MPQEAQPGAEYGTLLAAARLGEAASIGVGCWVRILLETLSQNMHALPGARLSTLQCSACVG